MPITFNLADAEPLTRRLPPPAALPADLDAALGLTAPPASVPVPPAPAAPPGDPLAALGLRPMASHAPSARDIEASAGKRTAVVSPAEAASLRAMPSHDVDSRGVPPTTATQEPIRGAITFNLSDARPTGDTFNLDDASAPDDGSAGQPWLDTAKRYGRAALDTGEDVAIGVGKGLANTELGVANLALKAPPIRAASDAFSRRVMGNHDVGDALGLLNGARKEYATPTNTAQKIGYGGEQIGEFFVPAGGTERAAKTIAEHALPAAEKWMLDVGLSPTAAKIAAEAVGRVAPRAALEGASAGTIAELQDARNPGETALISAAMPVAGALARPLLRAGADSLHGKAVQQVEEALGATKEKLKTMARRVAPDILDRGIVAKDLPSLQEKAAAGKEAAGEAIDQTLAQVKQDPIAVKPIRQAIRKARDIVNGAHEDATPAAAAIEDQLADVHKRLGGLSRNDTSITELRRIRDALDDSAFGVGRTIRSGGAADGGLAAVDARAALHDARGMVDDAIDQVAPTRVETKPIIDAIDESRQHFVKRGSSGKAVISDKRAYRNLTQLRDTVADLGDDVSVESLRSLRQDWDKVVSAAGGFDQHAGSAFGTPLRDQSEAWAKREATSAIRRALEDAVPDLKNVNAEFRFWKQVHDVVTGTINRRTSQGPGLASTVAEGAAAVTGALAGETVRGGITAPITAAATAGYAGKKLVKLFQSPGWKLVSAQGKDKLATALASGDGERLSNVIGRLSAGVSAQARGIADTTDSDD